MAFHGVFQLGVQFENSFVSILLKLNYLNFILEISTPVSCHISYLEASQLQHGRDSSGLLVRRQ